MSFKLMDMEKDEMARLDDVLTELKGDARTMAKDLTSGVEVLGETRSLLFLLSVLLGYFALVFLFVFPLLLPKGGLTIEDLAGGLTALLAIPYFLWRATRLKKKYRTLQSRYRRLLELDSELGK